MRAGTRSAILDEATRYNAQNRAPRLSGALYLKIQQFQTQCGCSEGGNLSMVIGRRYLHDIHPDDIKALEPSKNLQCRIAGKAAGHRRSRTRGKGWIQTVNIECQIGFSTPDPLSNCLDRTDPTLVIYPISIENRKTVG